MSTRPEELTDDELRLNVKSLSITLDALAGKMARLRGRSLDDARDEYGIINNLLTRMRAEQAQRMSA